MQQALLILGELNNDDLDWMVERGNIRTLAAGETLIYEGKDISAIYIVIDGLLDVFLETDPSRELARVGRGEVIGEVSFLDTRLPIATVKAVESSTVLALSRFYLLAKLEKDTGFAARFYRGIALCLSYRLRGTVRRLGYGWEADSEPQADTMGLAREDREKLELAQVKFKWLVQRVAQSQTS